MAVDMFLKCETIKGESKDAVYKESIDVLSWSWGESNSGSAHVGGGAGAGKVNVQDLTLTKWVDKASPTLFNMCAKGTHIPEMTLIVRKAGDKPLDYLVIKLGEVMVTSISTGGSGGEDRLTENVSFNFAAIQITYTEQKPDGSKGTATPFGWNVAQNAEWDGKAKPTS